MRIWKAMSFALLIVTTHLMAHADENIDDKSWSCLYVIENASNRDDLLPICKEISDLPLQGTIKTRDDALLLATKMVIRELSGYVSTQDMASTFKQINPSLDKEFYGNHAYIEYLACIIRSLDITKDKDDENRIRTFLKSSVSAYKNSDSSRSHELMVEEIAVRSLRRGDSKEALSTLELFNSLYDNDQDIQRRIAETTDTYLHRPMTDPDHVKSLALVIGDQYGMGHWRTGTEIDSLGSYYIMEKDYKAAVQLYRAFYDLWKKEDILSHFPQSGGWFLNYAFALEKDNQPKAAEDILDDLVSRSQKQAMPVPLFKSIENNAILFKISRHQYAQASAAEEQFEKTWDALYRQNTDNFVRAGSLKVN